jgi:hypothetical protein
MDKSLTLNESVADKIRKYRTDYNNKPNTISFMPTIEVFTLFHCSIPRAVVVV